MVSRVIGFVLLLFPTCWSYSIANNIKIPTFARHHFQQLSYSQRHRHRQLHHHHHKQIKLFANIIPTKTPPTSQFNANYLLSSSSSLIFLFPSSSDIFVRTVGAVLALASALHWLTWDNRESGFGTAKWAHITDLSCMGLLPISMAAHALRSASSLSTPALSLLATIAITIHMFDVRSRFDLKYDVDVRDKRFNVAFTKIVIAAAAALVAVNGLRSVWKALLLVHFGTAVKLISAYKHGGKWRENKHILDVGTAVFHVAFGLAIQLL